MSDRTGGSDEGNTMDLDELEVDYLSRGGSPPPMNSYRPSSPYRPISPSPLSSQTYRPESPPYRPMTPSFHPYARTSRRMHGEEGEVERAGSVQSTKMWISQGRASTRQELSCMRGRRLVLLSGPCAVQKNVGGGADSGLRALPLAFFDAHICLFTILDVFEILFCGAGHVYSCAQAVSTTTLFRFSY
ncbi:hypothetical protein P692DRAFT_20875165 [Suillus brevipes Sb2]|nr:hypothetical protein P692DRAFT_20875165 [Suillus brevipes Sb2]